MQTFSNIDQALSSIASEIENNSGENNIDMIQTAIAQFPNEAFLYFFLASEYASNELNENAIDAFIKTLEIKPDFHLAAYQLVFLCLITGQNTLFEQHLPKLLALPDDYYLKCFANGLQFVALDDVQSALISFEKGIALNNENPPLNSDIKKVIQLITDDPGETNETESQVEEVEISTNSALLDIYKNQS